MIFFLNKLNKFRQALLMSVISLSIISCGGGSTETAGISGTGIVSGSITGFGSIFVNGIEYEIDEASFEVDGSTGSGIVNNGELKLGMVVRLDATDNGDGTGVATNIVYEDIIEGPVTSIPVPVSGDTNLKEFDVLNLTVIINATTTTFEGEESSFGFDTIALDDVIEVSGFADNDGHVFATRIEKTGELSTGGSNNIDVEIHGIISSIVSPTEIIVNNITVHVDDNTELEDITALQAGLLVEVEGKYVVNDGSINAETIEGEDDDRDEITGADGELSLQGIVSDFVDSSDFKINSIPVDASAISSAITDLLIDGLEVEVEGDIIDGVLMADQLEVRASVASFKAKIINIDQSTQTIDIGYPSVEEVITLSFDNQSQLEDEQDVFSPFTFANFSTDMLVKVEVKGSDDDWIVTSLKRDDDTPQEFEYELEGVVTDSNGVDTLTVNGLVVTMDIDAEYEIDDMENILATVFFSTIEVGSTIVELSDKDQDGVFDEAEI